MNKRESAIRAAIERLDMTQEAKDALIDIWREVDGAYAEQVRDLKARLRAARIYVNHPYATDPDNMEHWTVAFDRATDLRRKNWKKP